MSDQDRISPYNINTESSRQVRRIKKKTRLGNYGLIQYQILQIEIISILWQTVGRISNEILGVKGLIDIFLYSHHLSTWYCFHFCKEKFCVGHYGNSRDMAIIPCIDMFNFRSRFIWTWHLEQTYEKCPSQNVPS